MRHGRGTMLCSSGSSYRCTFSHMRLLRRSVLSVTNCDNRSGEWCNDSMHGFGQLLLACGSSVAGCWWRGRAHGLCRHVSRRDGSTYEGSMVHGERRGRGKLIFAWADVYEGEVARDLPNGVGVMHTSAGSCLAAHRLPPSRASGDTIRGVFRDCEACGAGLLCGAVRRFCAGGMTHKMQGRA
jgi:hypothetical protein